MQQQITDDTLTTPDPKHIGKRLREAREAAGLSRPELAKMTGVPSRSIEKFETGAQEPTLSRIAKFCDALQTEMSDMTGIGVDTLDRTVLDDEDNQQSTSQQHQLDPTSEAGSIEDLISELDELRERGFEGARRKATSMIDRLTMELHVLEHDELIALADNRGLFRGDCPSALELSELLTLDFDKGNELCGIVEERIIDTAVLGVDLYGIEREPLVNLAEGLERSRQLEHPNPGLLFNDWGDHSVLVPALRPILRKLEISGNSIDLDDREQFPARKRF